MGSWLVSNTCMNPGGSRSIYISPNPADRNFMYLVPLRLPLQHSQHAGWDPSICKCNKFPESLLTLMVQNPHHEQQVAREFTFSLSSQDLTQKGHLTNANWSKLVIFTCVSNIASGTVYPLCIGSLLPSSKSFGGQQAPRNRGNVLKGEGCASHNRQRWGHRLTS